MGHCASVWTHFDVVGDFAFMFLQNCTVKCLDNEHSVTLNILIGRMGHCPPRSEPIDFVRSINTKIFSHCLILFALSYFNEYVKAKLFVINVKKKNLTI